MKKLILQKKNKGNPAKNTTTNNNNTGLHIYMEASVRHYSRTVYVYRRRWQPESLPVTLSPVRM